MKIPYFCCIGAELKRYAKDFDFMNQVYLYKVPTDDSIEEVLAEDYFKAISDSVLQDDILYIYEASAKTLHSCRFDKQNGHITAIPLASDETLTGAVTTIIHDNLTKNRAVISNNDGKIAVSEVTSTELGYLHGATSNIQEQLNEKAKTDLSNLTSAGKNIANWSSNVSNCITEIPQNINLKLDNGTLTLKAGSKVHIANGNLDEIDTTTADISVTQAYGGQYMVIRNSATSLYMGRIESSLSGTIANRPSSTPNSTGFYFATDENKMYLTGNGGTTWYSGSTFTLPLAIVTVSGGAISSIDQVFNGFGYIGSTVFALSGIKGLAPNGRNADGTLKNISFTVSSVRTNTLGSSTFDKRVLYLGVSSAYGFSAALEYLPDTNTFTNAGQYVIVGWGAASSGVITNLEFKTVFHAVDYGDTEYIAHQAMPSDRYIDLSSTTITDGMTLTAPADGYYSLYRVSSAAGQMIGFINSNTGVATRVFSGDTSETLGVFIPVSKGQTIVVRNSAGGSVTYFRFIYTNSAK